MLQTQVISLSLVLALSACGGGSAPPSSINAAQPLTDAQKIEALEASGKLAKLDRSPTIGGIDANSNGVRDDIEAVLAKKYLQPQQLSAAMQLAAVHQLVLLTDPNDRAAVKATSTKFSRAISCMFTQFKPASNPNPSIVGEEILALTNNTKQRLKAYLAFDRAMDGSVISLLEGNTCD